MAATIILDQVGHHEISILRLTEGTSSLQQIRRRRHRHGRRARPIPRLAIRLPSFTRTALTETLPLGPPVRLLLPLALTWLSISTKLLRAFISLEPLTAKGPGSRWPSAATPTAPGIMQGHLWWAAALPSLLIHLILALLLASRSAILFLIWHTRANRHPMIQHMT